MKTLDDAVETLEAIDLVRPVTVTDVHDPKLGARRRFAYRDPLGALCEVEIDADPSDEQLEALGEHLPVARANRQATIDKVLGASESEPVVVEARERTKLPTKRG